MGGAGRTKEGGNEGLINGGMSISFSKMEKSKEWAGIRE